MKSLEEICKAVGVRDVKSILLRNEMTRKRQDMMAIKKAQIMRQAHRYHKNGYSKGGTIRYVGEIPLYVFLDMPEFEAGMDKKERAKHIGKFLRDKQKLWCVDKL